MSRTVYCLKLQKEGEGLDFRPYPGELGDRIFNNICKEAWQEWINHQTILINEYRLNLMDQKSRQFLAQEMEKFLFGDGKAGVTQPITREFGKASHDLRPRVLEIRRRTFFQDGIEIFHHAGFHGLQRWVFVVVIVVKVLPIAHQKFHALKG